jgi:hypothetical protein
VEILWKKRASPVDGLMIAQFFSSSLAQTAAIAHCGCAFDGCFA